MSRWDITGRIVMATRRSTYLFQTEQDYEDAKNHIYREMYSDYNDSDKIWFRGSDGRCWRFDWENSYRVEIWSDCSDPVKAASILREHCGRYYDE